MKDTIVNLLVQFWPFIVSIPAIQGITMFAKRFVPDQHRALVPLAVAVGLSLVARAVPGVDLPPNFFEALGLGGVASSIRDWHRDATKKR